MDSNGSGNNTTGSGNNINGNGIILSPNPTMMGGPIRPPPGSAIYKDLLHMLDCLFCIPELEPYLQPYLDSYIQPYMNLYNYDGSSNTNGNGDNGESDDSDNTKEGGEYERPPYITLDPIQILWDVFRQGAPLCILFNTLGRSPQLDTTIKETEKPLNERKKKVYIFIKACKDSQIVSEQQLFTPSELFKDDTNSFMRVYRTLSVVIDEIQHNSDAVDKERLDKKPISWFLYETPEIKDNRWRAINELLDTERRYLQDLETLQDYMQRLQSRNIVSNDTIRYMFANLHYIVDFTRRLLIRLESNASLPPRNQRFGAVFIEMEEGFAVYEPYTSNYHRATELCVSEAPILERMGDVIEPHYALPSLLIKPVQRICKYVLLIREISKYSQELYPESIQELQEGQESVDRMVNRANESRRREENISASKDLEQRVEDWKGYNPGEFGNLHLHDKFVMSTPDTTRELNIYLFDEILVLVKEVVEKERRRSTQQNNQNKPPPSFQLKGRIFLDTIHRVVDTSRDNILSLTVYWRDIVMENFSIECRHEEQLNLWKKSLDELVAQAKHKLALKQGGGAVENGAAGNLVISRSHIPQAMNGGPYTAVPRFDSGMYGSSNSSVSGGIGSSTNSGRTRYSDGVSLTQSMNGETAQSSGTRALQYRKTFDGSAINKSGSGSSAPGSMAMTHGGRNQYPKRTDTPEHIVELSKTMERALNFKSMSSSSALIRHKSESEANIDLRNRNRRPSTPNIHNSVGFPQSMTPSAPVPSIARHESYDLSMARNSNALQAYTIAQNTSQTLPHNGFILSPAPPTPSLASSKSITAEDPNGSYFTYNGGGSSSAAAGSRPTPISVPQSASYQQTTMPTTPLGPATAVPGSSSSQQQHPPPPPMPSVAKTKVHFKDDTYVLLLSLNSTYNEMIEKVEKKIKICAGPRVGVNSSTDQDIESSPPLHIQLKYMDEDGDLVVVRTNEDVQLAFVSALDARTDPNTMPILNLYPTL
ncbi:Guanine nucleotide exchange factor for Cdc42p [Mycoemilia scoparia]|uniref:Guanine nucleotide exchange factor for Cdc42p n=1 Tax=Mycoemilia scoparia TaxID=417184 RepID=A0A9W8DM69_9FUNG|nr:Guanine nucleotide exchange factor for Cdc42p [Mycoemilia scoparia]